MDKASNEFSGFWKLFYLDFELPLLYCFIRTCFFNEQYLNVIAISHVYSLAEKGGSLLVKIWMLEWFLYSRPLSKISDFFFSFIIRKTIFMTQTWTALTPTTSNLLSHLNSIWAVNVISSCQQFFCLFTGTIVCSNLTFGFKLSTISSDQFFFRDISQVNILMFANIEQISDEECYFIA